VDTPTVNHNSNQWPFTVASLQTSELRDITATSYIQSRNVVSLQNFCKVKVRLPAGTDRWAGVWRL